METGIGEWIISVFLLHFISNESNWITLIGAIVAFAGFFYISYEILDRPHGSLRMILLLALFVLLPLFIVPLPFLLFTFIFWGNLVLRQVGLIIVLCSALLSGMIGGFYGIFVIFHELSPGWSHYIKRFFSRETLLSYREGIKQLLRPLGRKKRFSRETLLYRWRSFKQFLRPSRAKLYVSPSELFKGALIGFLWLSVYWLLFFVLFLKASLSDVFLPITLICGSFGAVAGGIWLGYIHKRLFAPPSDLLKLNEKDRVILVNKNGFPITSSSLMLQRAVLLDQYGNPIVRKLSLTQDGQTEDVEHTTSKLNKPAIFNRGDARKGGCFWLLLPSGILAALLLPGGTFLYLIYRTAPLTVLLVSLVTAAILGVGSFFSGWFVGGIARFASWWIEHCSSRTLGYFGIILTILGLTIGLIVPTIAIAGTSVTFQTNTGIVHAVAWSPDDTHIAVGNDDGSVQIWDVISDQRLFTFHSNNDFVYAIAWSPDGRLIASGGDSGIVQVWDPVTSNDLSTYDNKRSSDYGAPTINTLAWSPDGTRIASGDDNGTVQVWDALSGLNIHTYDTNTDFSSIYGVNAVAWSPDGTHIASGEENGTVQVWNVSTHQQVCAYSGHYFQVYGVAWSPDGTRIASGSEDNSVQVWNADTCQPLFSYSGHSNSVNAVAWSPDGIRIASGSSDGTVQIWGATTGDHIATYQNSSFNIIGVNAVAWSHDGTHIMAGRDDGVVQIWTV